MTVPLPDADADFIETAVALWSDDVHAELFLLPAVEAAAQALRSLELADASRAGRCTQTPVVTFRPRNGAGTDVEPGAT
jgi:hypothetical protein